VAGVAPEIMGIGPVEAIPRVLRQAGISQHEVDWVELNEAFAAQALAVMRTPRSRSGEGQPARWRDRPWSPAWVPRVPSAPPPCCTDCSRTRQRYGMVSMCIGTGMGAAGLFESIR
jgi:acetyl-CoA acyltransferase